VPDRRAHGPERLRGDRQGPELPPVAQREAPAIDTECHDDHDGGFVDDPHGLNLEAVFHHPEDEAVSCSRYPWPVPVSAWTSAVLSAARRARRPRDEALS